MKLNKYICKMLNETWPSAGIPTEEVIEDWIVEWYTSTYTNVDGDEPRAPPMWLAGPRWYDRKKEKANENSTDR
tara:strand:+ start:413 stop:634 length:222 start_codon:yes stop_codon:yes gene_type:complete